MRVVARSGSFPRHPAHRREIELLFVRSSLSSRDRARFREIGPIVGRSRSLSRDRAHRREIAVAFAGSSPSSGDRARFREVEPVVARSSAGSRDRACRREIALVFAKASLCARFSAGFRDLRLLGQTEGVRRSGPIKNVLPVSLRETSAWPLSSLRGKGGRPS